MSDNDGTNFEEMSRKRVRLDLDNSSVREFARDDSTLPNETIKIEETILCKTDCELVIDSLLQSIQNNPIMKVFPRFLFKHMVAQRLISNLVIMEEELEQLRNDRIMKVLYSNDLLPNSSCILMYTKDYLDDITSLLHDSPSFNNTKNTKSYDEELSFHAVTAFLKIAQETDNISFSEDQLLQYGMSDRHHIDYIVQTGYLRCRRFTTSSEDMFWLAHPRSGSCVSLLRVMEQHIIASIRRTKYKELSSKQILKIVAKNFNIPAGELKVDQFEPCLLDLINRKLVKKVLIPGSTVGYAMDYILRLESDY